MKKKLFALSGVFLIVLVITGLWATKATDIMGAEQNAPETTSLVNGLSVQEMTVGSSLIVMGKCLETRSQWIEGRRLVTVATISVTETIKDDVGASETLEVVLPGGIDANRRIPVAMTYTGAPQISRDEEVFLFLTAQDEVANGYAVMGFAWGKFSIVNDNEGGKVVARDSTRVPIQKGAGMMRGNLQTIPLEEFKAQVLRHLKQ